MPSRDRRTAWVLVQGRQAPDTVIQLQATKRAFPCRIQDGLCTGEAGGAAGAAQRVGPALADD